MKRLFACALLVAGLLVIGCDSASNDDGGSDTPPPSVITGFYVVLDAPADAQVTYTVTEYDQYGTELTHGAPIVVNITTAGSHVIDLYERGADPYGVSVDAKLTAGSGRLRIELWKDADMESFAETERQNHNVCVTGGTCSH